MVTFYFLGCAPRKFIPHNNYPYIWICLSLSVSASLSLSLSASVSLSVSLSVYLSLIHTHTHNHTNIHTHIHTHTHTHTYTRKIHIHTHFLHTTKSLVLFNMCHFRVKCLTHNLSQNNGVCMESELFDVSHDYPKCWEWLSKHK